MWKLQGSPTPPSPEGEIQAQALVEVVERGRPTMMRAFEAAPLVDGLVRREAVLRTRTASSASATCATRKDWFLGIGVGRRRDWVDVGAGRVIS
jgi:hypothetical protein